jgi:hypothetical protein
MPLQQMTKPQDRAFVRQSITDSIDARKLSLQPHVVEHLLGRWISESKELLQ